MALLDVEAAQRLARERQEDATIETDRRAERETDQHAPRARGIALSS